MNAAIKEKHQTAEDWHPAYVVAALKVKGSSLAALERENRYAKQSLSMLWGCCWPRAQEIVADVIGEKPWTIWPTRYNADHSPKTGRIVRIPTRKLGRNV